MKIRKTILSAVFLLGAMGPSVSSAAAAASVVSKNAFTDGSYCHMKFPAIRERTLGTAQPVLKEADSGDIIVLGRARRGSNLSFGNKPKIETFSRRFDQPGTYDYNCAVHPYMTGRVVVRAK